MVLVWVESVLCFEVDLSYPGIKQLFLCLLKDLMRFSVFHDVFPGSTVTGCQRLQRPLRELTSIPVSVPLVFLVSNQNIIKHSNEPCADLRSAAVS